MSVDGGAAVPMTEVGGYYTAGIDLPDADTCSITVRAVSAGVIGLDAITVELA